MNAGKQFETDWRRSIPDDVYCLRLNDPAQAFGSSGVTRFAPHNPCDFIMYKCPYYFALELKSTKGTSLTFWREDFKRGTFMIKKWQIQGLLEASGFKGAVAGLLINFRNVNRTYFCEINKFIEYIKGLNKKSVNEGDVLSMGGLLLGQQRLKVNWRYDVEGFIDVAVGQQGNSDVG